MRGALTRLLLVVLNPQPAQAGKRAVKRKKRNLFVDDEVEVDDASDEVCGVRQRGWAGCTRRARPAYV